ncbi:MAG: hypothetical protein OES57_18630, partial [Acidimicrobiia bacterium]|nr:hypothetical protein [Acidimicrobiia bacterium]
HECLDADPRVAITQSHGANGSLSIQPRTAELTRAAVAHLRFAQLLAGPVVIVSGDDTVGQRAQQGLERALDAAGVRSSTVTVPTSQGVQAVRRAATASVDAVRSARPATVLFASNTTVAAELGPELVAGPWQLVGVDVDGLTEPWAARRLPPAWRQVTVVSALLPTPLPDSEFEASCRQAFDSFAAGEALRVPRADWPFSVGRGVHSTRGAVDGSQSPPPDIGYHECTITRALGAALAAVDPPFDTDAVDAALRAGTHDVALGRRGTFADSGALAHHTVLVGLRPPDDLACAAAGQQCWVTVTDDRSAMVPFE